MESNEQHVARSQVLVKSQITEFDKELGQKVEGPPNETEEVISVHKFVTEPAKVTVDYGLTLNLGNYESARIGVAVSIPCYKEEIEEAHVVATKWAEEKIMQERDDILSSLKGGGKRY